MTLTFPQAAAKLNQTGTLLPPACTAALRAGGDATVKIADVTGGRMRNAGKNGADLTATVKMGRIVAFVNPRPLGLWHIAESGAAPHVIGARRLGSRRKISTRVGRVSSARQALVALGFDPNAGANASFGRFRSGRGAKALHFGSNEFAAYARHPGAKGRGRWTATVNRAEQVVPPVVTRTIITKSLKAVF